MPTPAELETDNPEIAVDIGKGLDEIKLIPRYINLVKEVNQNVSEVKEEVVLVRDDVEGLIELSKQRTKESEARERALRLEIEHARLKSGLRPVSGEDQAAPAGEPTLPKKEEPSGYHG